MRRVERVADRAAVVERPGDQCGWSWNALVALDRDVVDLAAIEDTLGTLLKSREDVEAMRGERLSTLVSRAMLTSVGAY